MRTKITVAMAHWGRTSLASVHRAEGGACGGAGDAARPQGLEIGGTTTVVTVTMKATIDLSLALWLDHVTALERDPRFPPSEFTYALCLMGQTRLSDRQGAKQATHSLVELGAKEGAITLWFADQVLRVFATEIDEERIALLDRNIKTSRKKNVQVVRSTRDDWFPNEIRWQDIDLILANPPSVPEPPHLDSLVSQDRAVLFSGRDGREDTKKIVHQFSNGPSHEAELLLVGADYVLDDWLIEECRRAGLSATETFRRKVSSGPGQLDWEIRNYVQDSLGWKRFEVAAGSLSFWQVGYAIKRLNTRSATAREAFT